MKLFLKSLILTLAFHGAVMVLIPQLIIYFFPAQMTPLSFRVISLVLICFSISAYLWVIYWLSFHGQGTPAPFDSPHRLVTTGPYRYSRNPMYLAALTLLLGQTLYHLSLLLLIYTGIVFLAFQLFLILYEEPHLKSQYPHQAPDYFRRLPRWL